MRMHDRARKAYYLLCDAAKAGFGTRIGRRLGWKAEMLMIEPGSDEVLLLPAVEFGKHGRYGLSVQQVYFVDEGEGAGWHYDTGEAKIYLLGRKDNGVYKKPW